MRFREDTLGGGWLRLAGGFRADHQPVVLHPVLVALLREHRGTVPNGPNDRVFPIVPSRHSWNADRIGAGCVYIDGRGRQLSPHSLRKMLATQLDATGASPGVCSRILRHVTNLTQRAYIDPDPSEEVRAITALPNIWPENVTKTVDTGTKAPTMSPVAAHEESPRQLESFSGPAPDDGLRHISASGVAPESDSVARAGDAATTSQCRANELENARSRAPETVLNSVRVLEAQAQMLMAVAALLRGASDGQQQAG